MDILDRLEELELVPTKHVRRSRTKALFAQPDYAIEALLEMMGLVADGWDGNKTGNYKVDNTSSARVSLANMVRHYGLDWGMAFTYIHATPVLAEAWDQMNKSRAALLSGQMLDIADDPAEDMVQAVDKKTRIDVRKWIAERDDRSAFGQRTFIDSNVTIEINKIADLKARKQLAESFMDIQVVEFTVEKEESKANG